TEADLNDVGSFDHVTIAEDIAVRSDDHPGAETLFLWQAATSPAPSTARRGWLFLIIALTVAKTKEAAKERIIEQRRGANALLRAFGGVDGHDAASAFLHDLCNAGPHQHVLGQAAYVELDLSL